MKKRMRSILALALVVFMCFSCLVACGGKDKGEEKEPEKKLTEAQIQEALKEDDGTLTIEGSADDVKAFKYVLSGVNTAKLTDKSFTKTAVNTLLQDSSKITFGQLKVCNAFNATMNVVALFTEDDGNFNSDAFINEILEIICDGQSKTYGDWTVSATIDTANDSITISAKSK